MTIYVVVGGETCIELSGREFHSNSVTIRKVIDECLAAKTAANFRPSYLRTLRLYLNGFARGKEARSITSFDLTEIERWFQNRKEKPITMHGSIGRLSSMFTFAVKRGYVQTNPCDRLERPRLDHGTPVILTPVQVRSILHHLTKTKPRKRRLAQAVLSIFCGVRPIELTRLFWRDIDIDRAIVRIDGAAAKTRQRRIVPIPPNAIEWLRLCDRNDQPIGSKQGKWIRGMCRSIGLKWTQDVMRHSAASYLTAKYEDLPKISRWLGNSPAILLQHYIELVSAEDCVAFWAILPKSDE